MAAKPTHEPLLRCRWDPATCFTPEAAVRIMLCVAKSLAHLHSLGICHGDVYAHNVLADEQGHAVLCDYGVPLSDQVAVWGWLVFTLPLNACSKARFLALWERCILAVIACKLLTNIIKASQRATST